MTRDELTILLKKTFPKSVGLAVTGSQANSANYRNASDIDVLIFDTFNSDVTTIPLTIHEVFKVDCTVIPILNIENVIINEFADTSNTAFNMLKGSAILHDPFGLVQEIKDIVAGLQLNTNHKILKLSESLNKKLNSFKKYFVRDLTEQERILLIADFITLITKIAVIDKNGWDAERLRKAKILSQEDPAFLNEIVGLFNLAIKSENLGFINPFIDRFQSTLKSVEKTETTSVTIDLSFPEFSLPVFCKGLLSQIMSEPLLKQCFLYFYASPRKYYHIYKHHVSICFGLPDKEFYLPLIDALNKKIANKVSGINFEQVFILDKYDDDSVRMAIEEFRKILSHFWLSHLSQIENDRRLIESVCLRLSYFIYRKLDFDLEDFCYLNNAMLQKWLLEMKDQRHAGGQQVIVKTGQIKIQRLNERYQKDKSRIFNTMRNHSGVVYSGMVDAVLYGQLEQAVSKMIEPVDLNWHSKLQPQSFYKFLQIKKSREADLYKILMEEIFQMLNVPDDMKTSVVYFSFMAWSDEIYAKNEFN